MSASPVPLLRSLGPRDPQQGHRAASPLELLTDLCFVVAISQSAALLHHEVSAGSPGHGLLSFVLSFFGIFWAWLNFTWFGSAYDNDDVGYRLVTILQILGSLVYAAGITDMFSGSYELGVAGYVVMRVALVVQWLRAARADPDHRSTCYRYVTGISVVQVLWLGLLLLPAELAVPAFLVLVLGEISVPVWAERPGLTPWHPHHIAERYGLFFIIVLGETILSTTVAIQEAGTGGHLSPGVAGVAAGGVLIVFSTWWLYFSADAGAVLADAQGRRDWVEFVFGYGHYAVLASGAAVGAGLAVRVDTWTSASEAAPLVSAAMVSVPTAALLASLWLVVLRPEGDRVRSAVRYAAAVLVSLAGMVTPVPELVAGLACVGLLTLEVRAARYPDRSAGSPRSSS